MNVASSGEWTVTLHGPVALPALAAVGLGLRRGRAPLVLLGGLLLGLSLRATRAGTDAPRTYSRTY